MTDHTDPFSVYDGTTTSMECQPILENDTPSTSTLHSNSTVSTTLLATEFPDGLLSDSTDSDSCSDYTVHSNSDNDDDSDWEDVREDSGAPRFQFADPVAEMLDSAVQSGLLPREHIFYKLVSGALEYVLYDHSKGEKYKWDPALVRWSRSLLRLGRSRTFNFLRGPGGFNATKGKKGKGTRKSNSRIDFSRFGIPLPSRRTVRRTKPGYSTASGIIRNLLISILRIAHLQSASCYVNNSSIKAIAISLTRDGLGLKPSLEFDERKKVLVGSKKKIDIDYIKQNPVPDPSELKKSMIKDADISVVTTVDRKISLPVGVYYEAADQTGEEVVVEVEKIAGQLQTCLSCLEAQSKSSNSILIHNCECTSRCESCLDQKEVCRECQENSFQSIEPQLRPCSNCIADQKQCVKFVVTCYSTDCEQKNKTALELLQSRKEDDAQGRQSNLRLTEGTPDAVHVGKCLKGSLANWWLVVDDYRVNLAMLRTIRQDYKSDTGKQLRQAIKLESVRHRDKMSTESVAEICSEKCLSVLESIQSRSDEIVYTLVPEKHRHTDDNKTNTFKLPVDLVKDTEDMSKLYVADSHKGTLAEVRLHYPATVKIVATGYTNPMAVAMVHGIVIVAEKIGNLYCVDLHSKLKVNVSSMKKPEMEAFVARNKIKLNQENAARHSREELKSAISQFLQSNKKTATSKGTKLELQETNVKTPVVMTSLGDEILFIADTGTKKLVEVRVEKDDFKLSCYTRTVLDLNDNVNPTGLCVIDGQQKLLLADSGTHGGLLVVNLEDGTTLQLLRNGSATCSQIHGVCFSDQSVIFTDTKSHSLKRFSLDGTDTIHNVDTITGNGTSGTEDGLIGVGRVSYPTGIIAEYGTIFFVDTSSKSVRLVTRVSALIKYIRIMEDIYRAFHVHSDILGHAELPSLSEAQQRVEKAEKMLTQLLQNAKTKFKVSGVMQGPQGTPAEKTVTSVTFIKNFLRRLQSRFSEECPHLLKATDVRTCLTLVNEYFNSEMRQVTDTPTVLDCAMNFVEAADETLKRIAWPGYICFTREKEHYELPSDFSVKYEDLLPVPQEPCTSLNKEDITLLNDWRNEFGRGVRQQSVRNSFTKDKAGTLPFYMYTSDKDAEVTNDDLAQGTVQELFKSLSSPPRSDAQIETANRQLSEPGNSNASDTDVVPQPERLPHTGVYAIRSRSSFFSVFISDEIEEDAILGTEYDIMDESSFVFTKSGKGTLTSCKKINIFCEIDKEAVTRFDGRLQLTEETFCKILSDCRSEYDPEFDDIAENNETTPDSEEETDCTGLTTIWSRRRSVRPPRHMEDFY